MDHIKVSINDFEFNKKEALFLERHVWDKYSDPEVKQVNQATRLMVADLAMHSALKLAYDVDTTTPTVETFILSTSGAKDFLIITIGKPIGAFDQTTDTVQYKIADILSVFDIVQKNAKGKRFGDDKGIGTESVIHPLRCFLSSIQNKMVGFISKSDNGIVAINLTTPGGNKITTTIVFTLPQ